MVDSKSEQDDEEDVLIPPMSVEDALSELQSSPTQDCDTTRNQKLAKHILMTLETCSFANSTKHPTTVLRDLAEFAITRRNLELWIETSSLWVTRRYNHFFSTTFFQNIKKSSS